MVYYQVMTLPAGRDHGGVCGFELSGKYVEKLKLAGTPPDSGHLCGMWHAPLF